MHVGITVVLLSIMTFLCGSFMFSYWIGLLLKKDLITVGDGNPGAFNLWIAAGYQWGIVGIILDFSKAYLPLILLLERNLVSDVAFVPVAIAPILGHAFSPFIRLRGGKAIAVTFGVWSAVTGFKASLVYAVILALLKLIARWIERCITPCGSDDNNSLSISSEMDGFMAVFGILLLGVYLKAVTSPYDLLLIWLGNLIVLTYTNRKKIWTVINTVYHRCMTP